MSLKSGRQVQRTVDGDPDNAPYMTDKLVTRWAQSSKRTETTAVKESKAANEVLGEYVSTALEPGSAKLASHIVGKKWWQSQQRMEAQVDAEAEHTNNWLDVLQHERTTSKEK